MPRPLVRSRQKAISRLQARKSPIVVTNLMDVAMSTMCGLWRCFQVTGNTHDAHRTGRSRVTSLRQDRPILRKHQRDNIMCDTGTARITVGSHRRAISCQTVHRRVREGLLLHCRPQRRPILTARHGQQSFAWAQHHSNWT